MNRGLQIDLELYQQELNKLSTVNYIFPNNDSLFMRKKGQEYTRAIDENRVVCIKDFVRNICPYNIQNVDLTDQQVCFALMIAAKTRGNCALKDFPKRFGFDTDLPPDQKYCLLHLWTIEPTHPLLVCQPKKSEKIFTLAQKNTIITTFAEGKTIKALDAVSIDPSTRKLIANGTTSYHFMKFKMNELKKGRTLILEGAKTNPFVAAVLEEYAMPDLDMLNIED